MNWTSLIGIALWALLPGFIAKAKGRNFWGYYFLSFIITPIITTIITICLKRIPPISYPHSTVSETAVNQVEHQESCFYCAEELNSQVAMITPPALSENVPAIDAPLDMPLTNEAGEVEAADDLLPSPKPPAEPPKKISVTPTIKKSVAEKVRVKVKVHTPMPSTPLPAIESEVNIDDNTAGIMPPETETSPTDLPKIRFCRHCGYELLEGSLFCSRCGANVTI